MATSIGGIANRSRVLTNVVTCSRRSGEIRLAGAPRSPPDHEAGVVQRVGQHVAAVDHARQPVPAQVEHRAQRGRVDRAVGDQPVDRVGQPVDVAPGEVVVEAEPRGGGLGGQRR